MSQKKKAHVSRASRRDRDQQAREVEQAIDAIGRRARKRRNGSLANKPKEGQ